MWFQWETTFRVVSKTSLLLGHPKALVWIIAAKHFLQLLFTSKVPSECLLNKKITKKQNYVVVE